MTTAVIQLLYDTLTRSPRPPPGRPQPWVAIVLFTVTVWALLPLAVKPAHSVGQRTLRRQLDRPQASLT